MLPFRLLVWELPFLILDSLSYRDSYLFIVDSQEVLTTLGVNP